jgi:hypothetical protein
VSDDLNTYGPQHILSDDPVDVVQQLGMPVNPANDPNAIVLGSDGDPMPHPTGTRMIEKESYERVVEGLKMAADACMHLAKQEPQHAQIWKEIGQTLDKVRLEAVRLAGLDLVMKQLETQGARGNPYTWRRARQRFLDGLRQATGGMRQLATCFRGDLRWSIMAQQLELRERSFRQLLVGKQPAGPAPRLILPPGFVRH